MTVPKEIKGLIERFQENRDVYCSGAYNEAQAQYLAGMSHEFFNFLVQRAFRGEL